MICVGKDSSALLESPLEHPIDLPEPSGRLALLFPSAQQLCLFGDGPAGPLSRASVRNVPGLGLVDADDLGGTGGLQSCWLLAEEAGAVDPHVLVVGPDRSRSQLHRVDGRGPRPIALGEAVAAQAFADGTVVVAEREHGGHAITIATPDRRIRRAPAPQLAYPADVLAMAGGWLFWSRRAGGRRALFAQRVDPAGLAPGPPVALGEVALEAPDYPCHIKLRGAGNDLFLAAVFASPRGTAIATTSLRPAGWGPLSVQAAENVFVDVSYAGRTGRVAWRVRDLPSPNDPAIEEGQVAVLEAPAGGPPRVVRCPPIPGVHRVGSSINLLGDRVLSVWPDRPELMARLGPIGALDRQPDEPIARADGRADLSLRGVYARGRQAVVVVELSRPRGVHAIRIDADGRASPVELDA
ncbi:MAG TPA: hypothetical protein VFS43_24720 [Polyangiaceae bacterium]|nr:hypothetical protein [Polyangiaceae bacterium]